MNTEVFDKLKDKIVVVSEKERWSDEFKEPTQFFIINAMDEAVFFKTRSRKKAREWADMLYGKDFFGVRQSMRGSVR